MKASPGNVAAFALAALLVLSGVASRQYAALLAGSLWRVASLQCSVPEAIAVVEDGASTRFRHRNALLDLHSLLLRAARTRIVEKPDKTVVLADNGFLCEPRPPLPAAAIAECVRKTAAFRDFVTARGAAFLYVAAPDKALGMSFPPGVPNASRDNHARFLDALRRAGVDVLDLPGALQREGIPLEDVFFVTDHHWKPEWGLWAAGQIARRLRDRHGIPFDESKCRPDAYRVENRPDWFLGSYGKKVGRFFSPLGLDGINLITPSFETLLREEQPAKNEVRQGDFAHTVLRLDYIEKRDLHSLNPYAAYSGGDFRLQKVANLLPSNGKKLLLVRDSFGCVVSPFLSLLFRETDAVDIRNGDSFAFVGPKPDLAALVSDFQPDCVVVLGQNTAGNAVHGFDFL